MPGEGALCSSNFAKLAVGRGKTHSCLRVFSDLVGLSARFFFSLLNQWYSCIGNDNSPCGLKATKCVSVCDFAFVAVALSVWCLGGYEAPLQGAVPVFLYKLKRMWAVWHATETAVIMSFCDRKGLTDEMNNLLLAHKWYPFTGMDASVQKFYFLFISQQLMPETKQYPFNVSHLEIKL